MKIEITISFAIGDFVYLKTDEEQLRRIVTGLSIRPNLIIYTLALGSDESQHYDFEISKEKELQL